MKMNKACYLLTLMVLLNISVMAQGKKNLTTRVTIASGQIEGTTNATSDIKIFKGIPFAAPPVGDLRWKAPQPVASWKGVRTCTTYSASPMQASPTPFMCWSEEFLIPKEPISEDCLYLNVWTGATSTNEKRPVLIYIYGGGFMSGGSACPIYDGEAMAKKGVILVNINYRVGVFGFLAHPELSNEADYHASGNYALLDMIAALRWVQKNISAFGGDPNKVTIAGQSAGAFGVNFLTASPLAKGLFHGAIAESGARFYDSPFRKNMSVLKTAEEEGITFAKSLNCNSLAELRAKPANEILKAGGGFNSPLIDNYLLTDKIADTYAKGKQNNVPVLMGWNEDDLVGNSKPTTPAAFKEQIQKRFGDSSVDFLKAYAATTDREATQSQSAMMRDEFFGIQMYAWAKAQTKVGSKAFVYNFNRKLPAYSPETDFGAFHTGEVVYAYNNLKTVNRPWTDTDYKIADVMSDYWINFVKTGDPNGKGLPAWDAYDAVNEKVMVIDAVIESKPLPDKNKMHFWENYFVEK